MEVRGLLRSAVKPDRARHILDNLPSVSHGLDEMLAELRSVYGSASVMCPLLVKKILGANKLGFDFISLSSFFDNFCLPWQRFCSISGDSLSAFLALLAVERMTEPCRDEWLRTSYCVSSSVSHLFLLICAKHLLVHFEPNLIMHSSYLYIARHFWHTINLTQAVL